MLVNAALKSNQVTHGGWSRSHGAFWDQNLHFISISNISTPRYFMSHNLSLKPSNLQCWEFQRGREWNMKSAGVALWEIYISNFSFQSETFWQNMKIDLITMLNASTLHSIWSKYTAAYRVYQRLFDTQNAISTEEKILHKTPIAIVVVTEMSYVVCSVLMLRCINEFREPVTYEPHLIEKFS